MRQASDRRNSKFSLSAAQEFNGFIDDANLHEYSLKGRRFTYVVGDKMSRIDRIFVNWNFFMDWPNAEYLALAREESDHCPLVLKTMSRNFGPKPFRFYNSWLGREDFYGVMRKALEDKVFAGNPDDRIMKKFRWLRKVIGEWNVKRIEKEKQEKAVLEEELHNVELDMESRDLSEEEKWVLEETRRRLRQLEDFHQRDLNQKSRNNWAKHGDDNTRYFHGFINKRRAANHIPGLMVSGGWETKPAVIKREVLSFFSK
ncbi:uncharacterized protein LOC110942488 [Helianthus annuus]|uniref:uncharacterized protein LOC110942488 n=1 Tax=Helianthus annuus TaxID=4232 RepID=UPI000B9078EA|nr:uncharacterized protein LOC110942488 [Helianthus annuus]